MNTILNNATQHADRPREIEDVEHLEELLSRPTAEVIDLFERLDGDLAIIGAGGKIGPSLTAMACRARDQAGGERRVYAISQFSNAAARRQVERAGAKVIVADLLDAEAVAALPDASNVIYMAGMKFGTASNPQRTWAMNTLAPANVAQRYSKARIVAFSTGCVYDLAPVNSAGSVETDPLSPIGEYANSCVARERVFGHCSQEAGTRTLLLRLNYAVEMRYGVLVDIAENILAGREVDLTMGWFNAIWQADCNAAALRLLEHAACPPLALNLAGPDKLSVREVATKLATLMGKQVKFAATEADTAFLSDASRACRLLGKPPTPMEDVLQWTARWIAAGKETLGKPTHYQVRAGVY